MIERAMTGLRFKRRRDEDRRLAEICAAVAHVTGLGSLAVCRGHGSRARPLLEARAVVGLVARGEDLPYEAIGRALGGLDHSTVLVNTRRATADILARKERGLRLDALRAQVQRRLAPGEHEDEPDYELGLAFGEPEPAVIAPALRAPPPPPPVPARRPYTTRPAPDRSRGFVNRRGEIIVGAPVFERMADRGHGA